MKQYFTKNGVPLTVIVGGSKGDGIPKGMLRAVMPDESPQLTDIFKALTVSVRRANYLGFQPIEIEACFQIDSNGLKTGRVDLQYTLNKLRIALESQYETKTFGGSYTIEKRAKKGHKMVVFHLEISEIDAARLGFKDQWSECLDLIKAV